MAELKNVAQRVENGKLILEIDLSQNHGLSSTGKTTVVASSGGFAKIEGADGISFSLNVNKKVPK